MSQLTNYGENKIADFIRSQGITLPASWHMALGSAASDSSFTELSGTGYARVAVARSLANFAGTQGPGTTLASNGTSHRSSNNVAINFGTPGGPWGTANYLGFFDASTGGNCWIWLPITALDLTGGSPPPVVIAVGSLTVQWGVATGCTHYLANKMTDLVFRGQAFAWPATVYFSLYLVAPTNAGGGTEVALGSYARQPLASNMTNWSGTQAAGSTVASSGTTGVISNNVAITFPVPTADQGAIEAGGLHDSAGAGNLLLHGQFPAPQSILSGSPARSYAAGEFEIEVA